MSLDHAILGFLQCGPMSGYDLKAVFDLSVQHFWPADQSQIYRTLSRTAESGWASVEVVEQEDRPDRKIYHITDSGEAELHRWLSTPLPRKGERIQDLVQIFFAGSLSDDEIKGIFAYHAEDLRQALQRLRAVPERVAERKCESACDPRSGFFRMLTLEYGIRMTEASLAWVEDVLNRLEQGEHTKGEYDEGTGGKRQP